MSKTKKQVVDGVADWVSWWCVQRKKKLEDELNSTMSINPFMMPFLFDYHDLKGFADLAGLLISGHLLTGHNTGFGKLIDEKILPFVFDAQKLDKAFRNSTSPFEKSCFDEIDHLVLRDDGKNDLLSLKAGKWTIQLTMAVQLNKSFVEILENHPDEFGGIVVGVFYGNEAGLTDKYDILRGINRGANHDVTDVTKDVSVFAGRAFWSWLNDGEDETQNWVLEGILKALKEEKIHETASALLEKYRAGVVARYEDSAHEDGELDWQKFLNSING